MASFSDYLENKILGHVFGGAPYTPPALYIGLFTSAPTDAGGGTEVAGGSYVRKAVTCSVTGSQAVNSAVVEWPTVTGGGWGIVTHMAIFDAPTGGNMLAHGPLTFSRELLGGDVFRIPLGNLTIDLD